MKQLHLDRSLKPQTILELFTQGELVYFAAFRDIKQRLDQMIFQGLFQPWLLNVSIKIFYAINMIQCK